MSLNTPTAAALVGVMLYAGSLMPGGAAAENHYEKPENYKAADILMAEILQGKHYTIDEEVRHDGFFYHFSVHSDYGDFAAVSITQLVVLTKEIAAIDAMKQVETSDTAWQSLQQSGKNTVTGVKNLFSDPEGTIRGAGEGVNSLFNRAKVTLGSRELTESEDSRMKQLIGMTKAKGEIANTYGVSIYSRNEVLQEELDRLATADYLGGITVGVATSAVSGIGGVVLSASGGTRLLNETINATSPAELWLQNEKKLTAITGEPNTVALFLNNPVFTPAQQTVMAVALEKLEKAENRDLFVKVGLQASTPQMAKLITDVSIMAAAYHNRIAPLTDFAPMARLLKGGKADGGVVVLLPTDHLIWTQRVASVAEAIMATGKSANVPSFEIWTMGSLSDTARSSLISSGWQVHENGRADLFPEAKVQWPVKQQR